MDDPSKPEPSVKTESVNSSIGIVKCCQVPGKSTNFRSTITTLCFFASSNTSFAVIPRLLKIRLLFQPLGTSGALKNGPCRSCAAEIIFDLSRHCLAYYLASYRVVDLGAGTVGDVKHVNDLIQLGRDARRVHGEPQLKH